MGRVGSGYIWLGLTQTRRLDRWESGSDGGWQKLAARDGVCCWSSMGFFLGPIRIAVTLSPLSASGAGSPWLYLRSRWGPPVYSGQVNLAAFLCILWYFRKIQHSVRFVSRYRQRTVMHKPGAPTDSDSESYSDSKQLLLPPPIAPVDATL